MVVSDLTSVSDLTLQSETGKDIWERIPHQYCLYPIDARPLWDSIRVLTRDMETCRRVLPELNFAFAKRTRKAKKLCYAIVMAEGPKAKNRREKLHN